MEHYNWGVPVAVDLFAAALGGAAFMIAAMSDLANGKKYRTVSTVAAFIAPWPAILGVLLLVVDLGNPLRFWEMVLRRGVGFNLTSPYLMFNSSSTMSWGTWILSCFIIGSLIYLVLTVAAYAFRWIWVLRRWLGTCIGAPGGILVMVYTGVLLSGSPNPLWCNWMLPLTFVASAMVTGVAAVVFVLAILRLLGIIKEESAQIPALEKLGAGFIIFQLVAMLLFILSGLGGREMLYIIGPGYGALWWVGIVGFCLVLPLALYSKKGVRQPAFSLGVSVLLLLGGFFLRYVILLGGQIAV